MAHPSPPWPQPLADCEYRLARIEQPITTAVGSVTVDLLFVADTRSALLAVEVKDGTVQDRQARSYDAMTPLDIVQGGSLSLADPSAAVVDVAYAVDLYRAEPTEQRCRELAVRCGVIGIGTQVIWHGVPAHDLQLRRAFQAPIPADPRAVPRLLLVDDQSPPEVLAPAIANELLGAVVEGRESVAVDSLIERACWVWVRFGRGFQGLLRRRVIEMLTEAQRNELHDVIVMERAGRQTHPAVRLKTPVSTATTQAGELREVRRDSQSA